MSFLRCEYLVDLPGVVEAYMNEWRDRQREESIRELPDTLSDWGFSPEEIAKLRPGVENLINEYIGPEVKLCPNFKARMVDYIRLVQDEVFDVAFGLLLDEAKVIATLTQDGSCHLPDKDDFDDLVLGFKLYLKQRLGIRRNTKPRKRTPEIALEADQLFRERHLRIRAAAKDYTRHKRSPAWTNHIALEDKKRPGKPKIPMVRIKQLSDHSPREIALEWSAEEMNRRHSELGATANTIRSFLRTAERKAS